MTQDPGIAITHGETAGVTETTDDNLKPPLFDDGPLGVDPGGEVDRLGRFLEERFPAEADRTNRQVPETAVDIAIRLLTGMAAAGVTPRCEEEYCNKPFGHRDQHGWVHYQ